MDKKEFERLEDAHFQKMRRYDEAAWDLYDIRQDSKKTYEELSNFVMSLQHNMLGAPLNFYLFDLADSFEAFDKWAYRKEDDLEELRYQEKQAFMKKTESYKPSSFW
ncbi:hypothetical protein [Streptococcus macacae]|uniref:Uncharacterized protein n=1 Tax=Streptococcus macacae NCTC 11558 TaxID=764298 RepID=G5JYU8_9STRE|nr:hypothetical protein [Streptococcus macacae]EHJ53135.1 hypothetical protein STRMA_0362 [Streptococcus macacae NCTC 11558]SUN78205.1 Uncharacterised protein [Streptococcus macacae NCTC 11558]